MNRRTVTVSAPLRLWGDLEALLRGVARVFYAVAADEGLEELDRVRNRIAQSSRHWLMG